MSGQSPSTPSILSRLSRRLVAPVDAAARRRAVLHVVDWLGTAFAGAAAPQAKLMRQALPPRGGAAFVIGSPMPGSAREAAFLNGALGNILEMDDIHRTAILHPGPVVVPVALALAEERGADGTALLDAIVRGYEAMIRIGAATGPAHYRYFHNTATCGPFGAAAAAASLLALDEAATADALGNAGTQAAGLWQMRHEQVPSKQWHTAHAAETGLEAAILAAAGFAGPKSLLEGTEGFFAALCGGADAAAVLSDPDAAWRIFEVSFKPWPACRHAHAAIDAALLLRPRINGRMIARITIKTYADAEKFCNKPEPTTALEAKFSLQHAVAVSLAMGPPRLADFEPHAIAQPALTALRRCAEVTVTDPYRSAYPQHYGSGVDLTFSDGTTLSAEVADALGDPENPLDEEQIALKALTLMAAGGLDRGTAAQLIEAATGLAKGGDFGALSVALRQTSSP